MKMAEQGKVCTKCGEWKLLTGFHKNRTGADGLAHWCKACVAAYGRAWRADNPEKVIAQQKAWREANSERAAVYQKAWREANPERVTAYQKAYRETNREEITARKKAYREANKEEVAARQKAWHEANKEEVAAQGKVYREINREEIAARKKDYRKANPDKVREGNARRRALKAGADGSHTCAEFRALCGLSGWVCLCCETSHEESPLTVDHVVPLSEGGSDSISNLQPLCGYCNDSKGTKTIDYRGGGDR